MLTMRRSAQWNVCTDSCSEEDITFVVPFVYFYFLFIVHILAASICSKYSYCTSYSSESSFKISFLFRINLFILFLDYNMPIMYVNYAIFIEGCIYRLMRFANHALYAFFYFFLFEMRLESFEYHLISRTILVFSYQECGKMMYFATPENFLFPRFAVVFTTLMQKWIDFQKNRSSLEKGNCSNKNEYIRNCFTKKKFENCSTLKKVDLFLFWKVEQFPHFVDLFPTYLHKHTDLSQHCNTYSLISKHSDTYYDICGNIWRERGI